jgi:hypothetical protein
MKTKPTVATAARRRGKSDPYTRSVRRPDPGRAPASSSSPGIIDAVIDQHGGHWIRYGSRDRSVWFAAEDLISASPAVFRRLSSVGAHCLTRTSQDRIKREVEAHTTYRAALVASRPGWLDGHYIFGDGTVAAPPGDEKEVIVAFEGDPKFTPQGTLAEWQASVGPLVADQPLALFALALAFVGPLLRFAPAGYTNPLIELVGPRECGKSSLGVLAASVWAGNPDSDTGGGETWDLTLNALDDQKRRHRDNFLLLNEGNLVGASSQERRNIVQQAVFKLAETGERRRFGDEGASEHARCAVLSTTNTPLEDLVEGSPEVRGALHSRMVTLRIDADRPFGVLASIPAGCATSREAMERLRVAADENYGVAGRAFMKRLVRDAATDEEYLRHIIARGLDSYLRRRSEAGGSARVAKCFALVAVAGALARRYGVLPEAWDLVFGTVHEVQDSLVAAEAMPKAKPRASALDAVSAYVARERGNLIPVGDLTRQLAAAEFEKAAGFLRKQAGRKELLVPAARFQREFPDHVAMMRELRSAGLAKTEGGDRPKLTIKAPRAVCEGGRLYCVVISPAAA